MGLTVSEKREFLESRISALELEKYGHEVNGNNHAAVAVIDEALVKAREALAALA